MSCVENTKFGISLPVKFTIRPLTPADAASIRALYERARLVPDGAFGLSWTGAQVEAEALHAGGWVTLDSKSEISAFVFLQNLGQEQEILMLATDPVARGQGCMSRMLRHVFSTLQTTEKVWLEVHELNAPARQLYEKLGFLKVGERRRYYADGGSAALYTFSSKPG